MEVWSRGLGDKKLNLRLNETKVENCGETIVIRGVMGAPVYWDFSITMEKEDILDVFIVATQRDTVGFLLQSKKCLSLYLKITGGVIKFLLLTLIQLPKKLFPDREVKASNEDGKQQLNLR